MYVVSIQCRKRCEDTYSTYSGLERWIFRFSYLLQACRNEYSLSIIYIRVLALVIAHQRLWPMVMMFDAQTRIGHRPLYTSFLYIIIRIHPKTSLPVQTLIEIIGRIRRQNRHMNRHSHSARHRTVAHAS